MRDSERYSSSDPGRRAHDPVAQPPRVIGTPLSAGAAPRPPLPPFQPVPNEPPSLSAAPAPGRALTSSSNSESGEQPSSAQRAIGALRAALPFVQRILPLLDGHFATAISNILASHPQTPPPPPVSLAPIESGLAELQTQHRELSTQVVEQNASLKRVEDQLEMVREATDRNTLEQQELIEDLKGVGNKINLLAIFVICLLAISVFINVVLYLHMKNVLP